MFKKLLILIVAGLIYLHFYPNPAVDAWYETQIASLQRTFDDATDTRVGVSGEAIYKDLLSEFPSFTPKEQLYVKEITLTGRSVKHFYEDHCLSGVRDKAFKLGNHIKVCSAIKRYSRLL